MAGRPDGAEWQQGSSASSWLLGPFGSRSPGQAIPWSADRTGPLYRPADQRGSARGGNGNGNNGNGSGNGGGNGSNGGGSGQGNNGSGNGNGAGNGNGVGNGNGQGAGSSTGTDPGTSAQPQAGGSGASGPASDKFVGDEILIIDSAPGALDKARDFGFQLIETRKLASLGLTATRLRTPRNVSPRSAIALLESAVPGVTADVNTLYASFEPQSAQVISLPAPDYARQMIGWQGDARCGRGYRIGMIDTHVAAAQPLLAGQNLHQRSFVPDGALVDGGNHGTVIASLLIGGGRSGGAGTAGLLPAADLYAAAVVEHDEAGAQATALAMAQALDWMVAEHVPLVNVSLSGGANRLLEIAVRRAAERSTVIVAAAGNGGPNAEPAYPGAYPQAIAITAVDQDRQVFPGANQGGYIAFAAPGVSIWAPDGKGSGQFVTGTSFAAPFAAAAAALEVMAGTPVEPDSLRESLAKNAVHLGPAGRNTIFGYGLVRADSACGAAGTTAVE
jgi:hypothetical protein